MLECLNSSPPAWGTSGHHRLSGVSLLCAGTHCRAARPTCRQRAKPGVEAAAFQGQRGADGLSGQTRLVPILDITLLSLVIKMSLIERWNVVEVVVNPVLKAATKALSQAALF